MKLGVRLHTYPCCISQLTTLYSIGHARPLCVLATRIARARDVYVTLLVSGVHWERVKVEVTRGFDAETEDRRKWLR